jgi:hypothetical protein
MNEFDDAQPWEIEVRCSLNKSAFSRSLRRETRYSASQIAWWMADLWFGLDASGFDNAGSSADMLLTSCETCSRIHQATSTLFSDPR